MANAIQSLIGQAMQLPATTTATMMGTDTTTLTMLSATTTSGSHQAMHTSGESDLQKGSMKNAAMMALAGAVGIAALIA